MHVMISADIREHAAQVVMVLKKEIMKTQNKELEKAAEYRHLLVHAIHECAANFPDIAANVIHLLMDFLVSTKFFHKQSYLMASPHIMCWNASKRCQIAHQASQHRNLRPGTCI